MTDAGLSEDDLRKSKHVVVLEDCMWYCKISCLYFY